VVHKENFICHPLRKKKTLNREFSMQGLNAVIAVSGDADYLAGSVFAPSLMA